MQEYHKLRKNSVNSQKTVYDVAIKFNGKVTVSDIYTNCDLTIEEIEYILSELSAKNYVKSEMDEKSSVINYSFPDINKQLNNNKSLIVSTGIDKLILRVKYGNTSDKPTEYLEKAILQTAQEFNGKLSMAKIVEYTGLGVDDILDVISILCSKNICKREFLNDSQAIEFYFPEMYDENKTDEEIENNNSISAISKNISKKALKKIRQNTDRMLIKSKVNKYRRRYRSSVFLDTYLPGTGHMIDKRWTLSDFFIFSILPSILTGGLSSIFSVALLRYQDAVFYSLSSRDKNIKTTKINRNSIAYVLFYLFIYSKVIGMQGLSQYYLYLFSFLGF